MYNFIFGLYMNNYFFKKLYADNKQLYKFIAIGGEERG